MKRAISISIGSSRRDKTVEIDLLGQTVSIERRGTDGDMEKAARLYQTLDGTVDALGMGGADLGLLVDSRWYPLYSVRSMVRFVSKTPLVDGCGLKTTLERRAARFLDEHIGPYLDEKGRSVFVVTAVDRWGMAHAFAQSGYRCTYGDLMLTLGIPRELHSEASLKRMAALLMPIAGRIPFHWVYPTGASQDKRTPRYEASFLGSTVIAGDCHYITRYMPNELPGKVIVTNTTTEEDVRLFREAGVKYLITTTPVLCGRSFGTNMMEAALVAAAGWTKQVNYAQPGRYFDELEALRARLALEPEIQELN